MAWRRYTVVCVVVVSFGCGGGTEGDGTTAGGSSTATDGTEPVSTDSSTASTSDVADDTSTSQGTEPATSDEGTDTDVPGDACGNAPGQLFGPSMPWNTDITEAPVAADSEAVVNYLEANIDPDVGFQVDFSLTIQEADSETPREMFTPTGDFFSPDCDPAPVPVPEGGHLEGEKGYTCDGGGDCHLIVIDREECRLYEQWRADFAGSGAYQGGCLAVWDLDRDYDETLRGDYCTSADASGLPIAALTFTADEVASGEIAHAIRFIVPNANIRDDIYVRPGTHSTPATSGPAEAPPYSARLRLRADADLSGLSPAATVVAEAMQRYGIVLADAGNITFTAASDDFTTASWAEVEFGPHDLKALSWTDFEVIDTGTPIVWSEGDCSREPITR
ncbi:MAG: hypothetical protein AAF799_12300 [Myxococcota bacterium]